MTQSRRIDCPECGKPAVNEHKPFCSSRCRKVDLNRWLGGGYAIPGEPIDPSDIERMIGQIRSEDEPSGSKH